MFMFEAVYRSPFVVSLSRAPVDDRWCLLWTEMSVDNTTMKSDYLIIDMQWPFFPQ